MSKKVKVAIFDDSSGFRKLFAEELDKTTYLDVVLSSDKSIQAQNRIQELNPDVIILEADLSKPKDKELLRRILQISLKPVIIISQENNNPMQAISEGAVDFIKKPLDESIRSIKYFTDNISIKISMAYSAHIRTKVGRASTTVEAHEHVEKKEENRVAGPKLTDIVNKMASNPMLKSSKLDSIIIAIGASTGGTEATLCVLQDLPKDTPAIVVVQHMPEGFTSMYAERLNKICAMEVKEAEHGDEVKRGRVIIGRGDYHMELVESFGKYKIELRKGEKVSGHRPSVDVLFNSVAKAARKNSVGIILTGMGRDGADGLLKMRQAGAYTIGQDQKTSVVYGMPMVAYDIGAVAKQTSIDNIANVLKDYLSKL